MYQTVVRFDRALRLGQFHDFAVRSWVERDPAPDTTILFDLTIPAGQVAIHLAFEDERPVSASAFGPVDDEDTATDPRHQRPLSISAAGTVTAHYRQPQLGPFYGVTWRWA